MIEQAHLIEQLTQHPGWPVLLDWMHQRMMPRKKRLLNGMIPDRDEYLSTTGFLLGIHEIIDAPAKVAELVSNEQQRRQEREEALVEE